MTEPILSVTDLTKSYGRTVAVDDVSFEVENGEFFSFLGPSGCGKTTTLRMIAGLETPTSGSIEMNGEDLTAVPLHERDVSMVFQTFALFPNKTVGENVGFGLKMDRVPKAERRERVAEYLDLVDMPGFEDRDPTNLSGGQQQRVALARALITEPSILLLDEPLSSLDLKLRKNMRFELKRIQDELDTTFIYVTHDQDEALSMSDRIMLLNAGEREQVGTPQELYSRPASEFAADFIGDTNLFRGAVARTNGSTASVELRGLSTALESVRNPIGAREGDSVVLSVRPEHIDVSTASSGQVVGQVETVTFYGNSTRLLVDVDGERVLVEVGGREGAVSLERNQSVHLQFDSDRAALLEA
ncbi:ABC transporter ATP-binding protein [Halomarina oriensis]|uniref:Molybdate/tungstate import ATP-binding protein WtpC n=1 Tax=Halomarina oriensis TaxID=671145 RepID=A0A6B0GKU0_9EURY|nr:ABC transporter ATP-binding protein [Halomarina oriensis]MWG33413.1 ATP-binding cassette domain-containing protein [Halomarina oriensis]